MTSRPMAAPIPAMPKNPGNTPVPSRGRSEASQPVRDQLTIGPAGNVQDHNVLRQFSHPVSHIYELPSQPLAAAVRITLPTSRPPIRLASSEHVADDHIKSNATFSTDADLIKHFESVLKQIGQHQPPVQQPRRFARQATSSSFKHTVSNLFRRSSSRIAKDIALDFSTSFASENSLRGPTSNAITSGQLAKCPYPALPNTLPSLDCTFWIDIPAISNAGPADACGVIEPVSSGWGMLSPGVDSLAVQHVRDQGCPELRRRASSFDTANQTSSHVCTKQGTRGGQSVYQLERLPWPFPPHSGPGTKARRVSLNLPDDFNVDVVDLQCEFEYPSKLLGRHGNYIGKGAASKVTLMGRKGCPSQLYAVKEFRGKSTKETKEMYDKKIKSEFTIARSLHHPNIVQTFRLCIDHGRWNHVMEYCSEGDMFDLVQRGHLRRDERRKDRFCLFKQLIQGVNYLHSNGIAHRDIKLENLLITKNSKLKITDFGVSEVFSGLHPGSSEATGRCGQKMGSIRLCCPGICGSEPYIAPEVLEKKGTYDPRALDVWSSAIILIYMTFGGAIWSRAEPGNRQYDKFVAGWEKWKSEHADSASITDTDYPCCQALEVGVSPPALRRILLQMLNPDPTKRISISKVIQHRFIKRIECCQLESSTEVPPTIDAGKKEGLIWAARIPYSHNHLPPKGQGGHGFNILPGHGGS